MGTTPPERLTLYTTIATALGPVLLSSRQGKLSGLYFADQPHGRIPLTWVRQASLPLFQQVEEQLREYAAGTRKVFPLDHLALEGTPLQVTVWTELLAIPFGHTITYSELATRCQAEDAVRAVGGAVGRNPISWIVPCHRVVGKDGALTGYAGGLARKKGLLDFEAGRATTLAPNDPVPRQDEAQLPLL